MKQILYIICSLFLLSTISSISWALADCPSSGYYHNCFGTYIWDEGDIYVGEWKYDKRHGQGTYTFPDGSKGEGEWKDSKPNGYFIEYNADRTIRREGIFKDGKFLYAETREKKEPSK